MSIEKEDLAGKVILEVGSGRGDTTRNLVAMMSQYAGAQLVVTDLSNVFFSQLQSEFTASHVQVHFVCTAAQELLGIANNSVDYLVCNYTICAINARAGLLPQAVRRFREVLKVGGKLFVEEEFPIDKQDTPEQAIWAEKWRILKSATLLTGGLPYQEISPEMLKGLCLSTGFENIQWTGHTEFLPGPGALDFFEKRLDKILGGLANEKLRAGFVDAADTLRERARLAGGMEIPYYRFAAQKGAN